MRFDWSVTLGTVLQLMGLVLAVVIAYVKLNGKVTELRAFAEEIRGWRLPERLGALDAKVDALWEWFTTNLERRHTNKP